MLQFIYLILLTLFISIHCDDDEVACFAGGRGSHMHPTTFNACKKVISWLVSHDKTEGLITFSRTPGVGYKVPAQWMSGNCVVGIDMRSDNDVDAVSFHDIAVDAYAVALTCIIYEPHLGGTRPVGPRGVMNVTLWGAPRRLEGVVPLIVPRLNATRISDE